MATVDTPEQRGAQPAAAETGATPDTKNVGAYSQRELVFVEREEKGELSFQYIRNDGETNHLIWLTHLKNIYSKQLPNMPKEYIARLVFERRHRSVGIVNSSNNQCIGGITYRTFPGTSCASLGEIAFCAVSATHQVKGHGTRLMNWTKEHARTQDKLSHFLTYADNNAVGYFAKQGFTKKITLPKDWYGGYIKEYDGVTLMEFVIHPRINYTRLAQTVLKQRASLQARLRSISNSHVVHPPLTQPGEEFAPRDPSDIAGVKEAGYPGPPVPSYDITVGASVLPPTREHLSAFMNALLAALRALDESCHFREPVDGSEVTDYYDIVKNPMDLGTMQKRLDSGVVYITLEIFLADLKRIWANARHYNGEDTIFTKAANHLDRYVDEWLLARMHHRG